jgi:N-acetylglucosamine kinase-like BadF-type ATPase
VSRPPVVLAVDGGGSKTDLALIHADGTLLSLVRGPKSSPHHVGLDGSLEVLEQLLRRALGQTGIDVDGQVADVAEVLMAGVDFPSEEEELREAVERRGWAAATSVVNDTFAILRAGSEKGWGVAVVCGTGMNCVGVGPDGRHARFPALGTTTGDWGGGYDLGLAAVFAAARSEDGRGPKTTLEQTVPAHFGLETPAQLAEAIHRGQIPLLRLNELPRMVLAEAERDAEAAAIVDRLAAEVVAFARVALDRLDLTAEPVEVLLGGGLLHSGDGRLLGAIEAGLREVGPQITARRTSSPPIVGAALLGLDRLGADPEAHNRVHRELGAAVARIGGPRG